MGQIFLLLFVSWLVAYIYAKNSVAVKLVDSSEYDYDRTANIVGKIALVVLFVILTVYSGTRKSYNDTLQYLRNFTSDIPTGLLSIKNIDWTIGDNPGFVIYQIIIKTIFGSNTVRFLTITAAIVNASFLSFYKKYSNDFALAIYVFVASTAYFFTLGAMKQVLAMAIGIWVLPNAIQKKYLRCVILLVVAVLFHPYVALFVCIPFLLDEVWSTKTVVILVITILIGSSFQQFFGRLIETTETFGDTFAMEEFQDGGVNAFRIGVFLVTPLISFFKRKAINEDSNPFLIGCVNLSFISGMFMLLASSGGANLIGRTANYFLPFSVVAMPYVISKYEPTIRLLLTFLCVVLFAVYLYVYFTMWGTSWTVDFLGHRSIFDLFR